MKVRYFITTPGYQSEFIIENFDIQSQLLPTKGEYVKFEHNKRSISAEVFRVKHDPLNNLVEVSCFINKPNSESEIDTSSVWLKDAEEDLPY